MEIVGGYGQSPEAGAWSLEPGGGRLETGRGRGRDCGPAGHGVGVGAVGGRKWEVGVPQISAMDRIANIHAS
jgi:hypothetical protein